ncbi:DUF4287 domain-containing protein [Nonomuraea sp. NPDC046802]|uniref:DUF4287 domain-containing protein n=1 Tax=Nonomuraea sp. NPDC046802 TaxID=3154919 RepID=UPI00340B71ED
MLTHGLVAWLKSEHGLGHGHATLSSHTLWPKTATSEHQGSERPAQLFERPHECESYLEAGVLVF